MAIVSSMVVQVIFPPCESFCSLASITVSLFIAHEGNTPVGFTQLYPSFSSVSLAHVFVLNDIFVHEQARRKGVASKLMSAATDFVKSLGAVRVSLSTATSNETAQALYQSAGWKRDEQFFVYHFAIPA